MIKIYFWIACLAIIAFAGCTGEDGPEWGKDSGTTGGLEWRLSDDGILTITGNKAMPDYTYIGNEAPWSWNNLSIKSVIIGDGVKSIGAGAFLNCFSLTTATIPSSVKSIGEYAFFKCYFLENVTIHASSPPSLGEENFTSVSDTLHVPSGSLDKYKKSKDWNAVFSAIGDGKTVIEDVVEVTGITLDKKTLTLNEGDVEALVAILTPNNATFKEINWSSLSPEVATVDVSGIVTAKSKGTTTITASANGKKAECEVTVNEIILASGTTGSLSWVLNNKNALTISGVGDMPDYSSEGPWYQYKTLIRTVVIGDDVTSIGKYAFSGCFNLRNITIPNGVKIIGERAFSGCTPLNNVTIPNSVTDIGMYAFLNCSSLTSISIPNSVINIGESAFQSCHSLSSIEVTADNPNYCSVEGVLFNKSKNMLLQYPAGKHGIYTIPDGVKTIGRGAFSNVSSLTSVTIPNSVSLILSGAFSGCNDLTSITIPAGVTHIDFFAIFNCKSLANVYVMAAVPPSLGIYSDDVGGNFTATDDTLHVPVGSLAAYLASPEWSGVFTTIVEQ